MWRVLGLLAVAGSVVGYSAVFMLSDARAQEPKTTVVYQVTPANDTPAPPSPIAAVTPAATPAPVRAGFGSLAGAVQKLIDDSGATVGVSLIELGGTQPESWSLAGSTTIDAASTYKLPALMIEAQGIAAGTINPNGQVCFEDSDYEDGWFDDYADGACFTRAELVQRAGVYSDNTAGHMLVRDVGGADALNAFAAELGATGSNFFDGNTTDANDLAKLLASEATGKVGGAAAQNWLYPNLVNTKFEAGIPAGVPSSVQVVHKTGELDPVVNDVAIVNGGAHGAYVLAVTSDNLGGDPAWSLIASISSAVWSYEAARI
jgi:beta-lactamase class A